jgi:DNA-binding HxlR family transcriptional regulator
MNDDAAHAAVESGRDDNVRLHQQPCLPAHPTPDVYSPSCPSRLVLDRIGGKWTTLITGALSTGPRRYSELRRDIPGVSEKMLAQTLRELERDGLVIRTQYPGIPPHVEYRLTELGASLETLHQHVREWAETNVRAIEAARARHRTGN